MDDKDKQIIKLKAELLMARKRIEHLERVVRIWQQRAIRPGGRAAAG
jgi:hypothetical protein